MGTTQDNTKEDKLELMREMKPADLDRLQRDLAEDNKGQPDNQAPGGSNQQ